MRYDCETTHSGSGERGYERSIVIEGSIDVEDLDVEDVCLVARSPGDHPDGHPGCPEEMRMFLVACHQASVSIETMSKYLGLDADTVRFELLRGIAAWNAAQRTTNEAAFKPRLLVTAPCD